MISIIISTHKPEYFEAVKASIEKTIGVAHEIIGIENHACYSICETYNIGESQAQYPYLCFVHEDVLFRTQDWGKHLISTMEADQSIGLIGIAGTKFKSTYPTGSWGQSSFLRKFKRGHIFIYSNDSVEQHIEFDDSIQPKLLEEVVCVDGVFMFTKKEIYKSCRYDDTVFTNFHGYDLDFSLQVHFKLYKVLVHRGIELVHLSKGNYTSYFTQANRLIQKKWRSKLPAASRDLGLNNYQLCYYNTVNSFISYKDTLIRKIKKHL
ncbi:MAG: glycosyltransferase family protein [Bacteroidales bacterium]|nr:glycosyltransferase family protein [Bacteroidales bacterium]